MTPITTFAAIFSMTSIVLTLFEYISARVLLRSETIIIIKMQLIWQQVADLNANSFNKLQNLRKPICFELAKIIDVDYRSIELLLPFQTRDGVSLTFHIRGDIVQASDVTQKIDDDQKSGHLCKVFLKCWNSHKAGVSNLHVPPKVDKIETREIHPDVDLAGKSVDVAAVISMTSANPYSNTGVNSVVGFMQPSINTGNQSSSAIGTGYTSAVTDNLNSYVHQNLAPQPKLHGNGGNITIGHDFVNEHGVEGGAPTGVNHQQNHRLQGGNTF